MCHSLLLLRASSLPHWKVYESVRSFMPMMLSRMIICGQRVLSARPFSSEIWTLFTVLLHQQNRGVTCISSLRGSFNCFCSARTCRRNSCFTVVSLRAAKAQSAKINMSIVMWGQSSKHGSFSTSEMPNSFLPPLLATHTAANGA